MISCSLTPSYSDLLSGEDDTELRGESMEPEGWTKWLTNEAIFNYIVFATGIIVGIAEVLAGETDSEPARVKGTG